MSHSVAKRLFQSSAVGVVLILCAGCDSQSQSAETPVRTEPLEQKVPEQPTPKPAVEVVEELPDVSFEIFGLTLADFDASYVDSVALLSSDSRLSSGDIVEGFQPLKDGMGHVRGTTGEELVENFGFYGRLDGNVGSYDRYAKTGLMLPNYSLDATYDEEEFKLVETARLSGNQLSEAGIATTKDADTRALYEAWLAESRYIWGSFYECRNNANSGARCPDKFDLPNIHSVYFYRPGTGDGWGDSIRFSVVLKQPIRLSDAVAEIKKKYPEARQENFSYSAQQWAIFYAEDEVLITSGAAFIVQTSPEQFVDKFADPYLKFATGRANQYNEILERLETEKDAQRRDNLDSIFGE